MQRYNITYYDFRSETYKLCTISAKDPESAINKINNKYGKYNIDLEEIEELERVEE